MNAPNDPVMTKEEAIEFFAEFFRGKHHIPDKIESFGEGFSVKWNGHNLSTYDFNGLTRLVLMAHDKCVRVAVFPANYREIKIIIWKRQREGSENVRHPEIAEAIETYLKYRPEKN